MTPFDELVIDSATSYDWVEVRPLGAGLGVAVPVIDGGLLDDDVEVPDPGDEDVEDGLLALEPDEPPTDEPPLALVEPFSAPTALLATLATLAALPRLGAAVEDVAVPLPEATENGLRLLPTSTECAGVD